MLKTEGCFLLLASQLVLVSLESAKPNVVIIFADDVSRCARGLLVACIEPHPLNFCTHS